MKTAIQFGAGNIGRGFIGNLLSASGYHVVFVDVDRSLIDALRERGEYPVETVGDASTTTTVGPVSAVTTDDPTLSSLIAEADLVTTAVGPAVLERLAPAIAAGISARANAEVDAPLAVIACENMVGGSSVLKEHVYNLLSPSAIEYADRRIGFPDSAVDRIVPPSVGSGDPLHVRVEEYSEWIVDEHGFVGTPPAIAGMKTTPNLRAYLERKLFTLNTGHAIAAYLGARAGYATIIESIKDPSVTAVVLGAMRESGEVLVRRYGFNRDEHERYIEMILQRFRNPYLVDETDRVAREPMRKLRRDDRLIKPLLGTLEYGTENDNLVAGAAAALAYRNRLEKQSIQIGALIDEMGRVEAIERITGLGAEESERVLVERIASAYESVALQPEIERYMRRRTHIVSLNEAERQIRQLIHEAIEGKEVIVASNGKPVVRLAPIVYEQTVASAGTAP